MHEKYYIALVAASESFDIECMLIELIRAIDYGYMFFAACTIVHLSIIFGLTVVIVVV